VIVPWVQSSPSCSLIAMVELFVEAICNVMPTVILDSWCNIQTLSPNLPSYHSPFVVCFHSVV
jgi:hypothetical protein